MASLYNLDLEKQLLSGLILHPQTRAETAHIKPQDFSTTNRVVLSAIDACHASGTPFSVFLLVDRLKSLGIKIADAMEPGLYVKSLEGQAVPESAVAGIARELKRTTIRRELHLTGIAIAKATERDEQLKATEMVAKATELFNGKINILGGSEENEPQDLFGTVGDFLNSETAYDTRSIVLPYPTMHDLYGALDIGVTTIVARLKVGKSSWWLSTLQQLAAQDKENTFRALVLDTELTREENQSRVLSAVSGVKEYLIRHKLYRKNREARAKVEAAEAMLSPLAGRVAHRYVGGMNIEEILSIARRWAFKNLKPGIRGLVVFDYIKLQGSDFTGKNPLHIQIGAKVEGLKNLSKELQLPILTFAQSNRTGEDTKEGTRLHNSSIIGGSDMIAQFSSNVYALDRLAPDELKTLCPDGWAKFTHRLIPIATRVLGPDTLGKNRLVRFRDAKTKKDRWCENCVLLRFDSFNVSECAEAPTLLDLIERQRATGIEVQAAKPAEEDTAPLL